MEKNQKHHDGGFMNGFLLGAIIGAAVVFFIFNEKGKKLLKTITEEGVEGFSELRDLLDEELDGDEEEEPIEEENVSESHTRHSHKEPLFESRELIKEMHQAPNKVKRFFRGIKQG